MVVLVVVRALPGESRQRGPERVPPTYIPMGFSGTPSLTRAMYCLQKTSLSAANKCACRYGLHTVRIHLICLHTVCRTRYEGQSYAPNAVGTTKYDYLVACGMIRTSKVPPTVYVTLTFNSDSTNSVTPYHGTVVTTILSVKSLTLKSLRLCNVHRTCQINYCRLFTY